MKHIMRDNAEPEIACYETEDGMMNLQIEDVSVSLSKPRFIELSTMMHRVGQILIDEIIEDRLGGDHALGLKA